MKLISATVRHYRTHRDTSVAFDGASTLITGPNEAGKSTFIEAVHRALFLKGKISGALLEEMKSLTHPGDPFVSVTFLDDSDTRCTIEKTFGKNATALHIDGRPTLTGDAADAELALRLGVADTIEGRGGEAKLALRWAHLWVRQGSSGGDPLPSVEEENRHLFDRLRRLGGGALQASDLDAALSHKFSTDCAELWTSKDKSKAGTALNKAEAAEAAARKAAAESAALVTRLESAIRECRDADALLSEKQGTKIRLEKEFADVRVSLAKIDKITNDLTLLEARIAPKRSELASLDAGERDIAAKASALKDASEAAAQAAEALTPAKLAAKEASDAVGKARAAQTAASRLAQAARATAEKLAAADRLARAQSALKDADRAHAAVEKQRVQLAAEKTALDALPAVSRQKLNALADKASAVTKAEATLQAMGARLHVLACGKQPVNLDGKQLAAGADVSVTETTELTVGDSVRIRIAPGAAGSLREAREALDDARTSLADALAAIPAADIPEAQELAERHTRQHALVKSLSDSFEKLNPEALEKRLIAARREAESARALADRLHVKEGDAGDEAALSAARDARTSAEEAEADAMAEFSAAESRAERTEAAHRAADTALAAATAAEGAARSSLATLTETLGDDDSRARLRRELSEAIKEADATLSARREEISALQPETLSSREKRLRTSLEQTETAITEARDKKSAAAALLRFDGASDPIAAADLAARTAERARRLMDSERTHASAVALLARLFEEQRTAVAEQSARPLAEAADRYLACVHGTGAKLHLSLDEDGATFAGATLSRPDSSTFPFESLSGGAREQVGVALRLAMTETLANGHGGALPVVLDDAFVNSDPKRVLAIHDMLDLATRRGLQVIVLSCHPDQYEGMGWTNHRLTRCAPARSTASPIHDADDAGDATPPGSQDESSIAERILAILRRNNDTVSMRALREQIGCELPELQAARDSLVAEGKVEPVGRGLRLT